MSTNSATSGSNQISTSSPAAVTKPNRYHPVLVTLHWLIAILIFGAFFLAQANEGGRERFRPGEGSFLAQRVQQGTPPPGGFPIEGEQSVFSAIGIYMVFGLIVLMLLIVRLFVPWRTQHLDGGKSRSG